MPGIQYEWGWCKYWDKNVWCFVIRSSAAYDVPFLFFESLDKTLRHKQRCCGLQSNRKYFMKQIIEIWHFCCKIKPEKIWMALESLSNNLNGHCRGTWGFAERFPHLFLWETAFNCISFYALAIFLSFLSQNRWYWYHIEGDFLKYNLHRSVSQWSHTMHPTMLD